MLLTCETFKNGDWEMGRQGDGEMGRQGDGEMGRQGDKGLVVRASCSL
ncbi:MAG: hypothetical protein WBA07_24115 [Rivularia sp. (in: cyanobacteria)]